MYAYIRGIVEEVALDHVVIEAGGIGYEIFCSTLTLKELATGTEAKLFTHLHLADGIQALYGFRDEPEREMFRKLNTVTRVGPKLAISVLSILTPSDIRSAIITNNPAAFDRVPGMGKKTAQHVILELAGAVKDGYTDPKQKSSGESQQTEDIRAEAVAALLSLGYDGLSASRAVAAVKDANGIEDLITKALRSMAKG